MKKYDRFTGCLLAGGLGDALGYPVEFTCLSTIRSTYGPGGIRELVACPHKTAAGLFSDDTQMTLFTANGLILAHNEGLDESDAVWIAYQRWNYTQTKKCENEEYLAQRPGDPLPFIMERQGLYSRRAPGSTCLTALEHGRNATKNDSKGCGGVMRVAPCGLYHADDPVRAFESGAAAAALTHHHPTGYVSAGALAMMIALIVGKEYGIADAAEAVCGHLGKMDPDEAEETLDVLRLAISLAGSGIPADEAITRLGEGWVAEEALAIALYCALTEKVPAEAMIKAVNHDGDSDSTGAICGNIAGAYCGVEALPQDWIAKLEMNEYIVTVARELYRAAGADEN